MAPPQRRRPISVNEPNARSRAKVTMAGSGAFTDA